MKPRLLDDNLYRFDLPQPSYWEATAGNEVPESPALVAHESCDVAVIGGGYTGLSTALHLVRDHAIDVRVLEAGHIGWGASGRNGGFCCVGGTGVSGLDLIKYVGEARAREFYKSSSAAVDLVRGLVSDEQINCLSVGNAELTVAHSAKSALGMQENAALLQRRLGIDTQYVSADECHERYFTSTEAHGALLTRPAFGLHPLRYCRGLAAAARRHGALLHTRSQVLEWSRTRDGLHHLVTNGGSLRAKRVVYACNGFLQEDLDTRFYGRTLPVISAIVVTRPLTDDELAIYNWRTEQLAASSRQLLNYFRLLPDKRLLFGGRGHTTGSPQGEAATYKDLVAALHRLWPEWSGIEIEYRWHGLIAFTANLRPSLGQLDDDPSVFFGYGFHGNGVNLASWSGQQIASWITQGRIPATLPAIVRGQARRFPLPRLRSRYLRVGLALAKWRDKRA